MSQSPGESAPVDDTESGTGGEPAGPNAGPDGAPGEPDAGSTTSDSPHAVSTPEPISQPPWWSQAPPTPAPPLGGPPLGGPPASPPTPYRPQGAPPPPRGLPGQPPGWSPAPPPPGPSVTRADAPAERDRLALHLIWEGVLALVVVALMVGTAAATSHQNLTTALGRAGYLGLVATGLAFSLRTRSPNLAVGPILGFSAMTSAYLITTHHWGKPAAFLVAIVLSTLIGLVLGVLVAVLSVPAWAASLGAGAVVEALMLAYTKNTVIPVRFTGSYSTALWYGLFFVVSVGGGALWLVPGLRGPLSAARAGREPGRWTDPRTNLGAVAGLTGSSFLAGLAAIPLLMRLHVADASGTNLTTLAFAAVLLGGTSVFGRRAGIFGTLLGVTIVAVTQTLILYKEGPFWLYTLVVGLAALLGLGVSRAIESMTDSLNRRPVNAPSRPPGLP